MPIIPHESIQVGKTYKIDKAHIITTGISPGLTGVTTSYRDDPSKVYIRVDSAKQGPRFPIYNISVLDGNFNVTSTTSFPPGQSGLIPLIDISVFGETELNKQKAERVRQLAIEKGIPGTSSQGPLGNILGYAGLPEVRPRIAGRKKTHKSKKSRKSKKTRKH